MKSIYYQLFCGGFLLLSHLNLTAEERTRPIPSKILPLSLKKEGGVVLFTPPSGWYFTDPSALPTHVQTMVVGKGHGHFPPSMNLSSEPFEGTLRDYLKIVKTRNQAQGYEWKDLGNIRTESGNASLSQVDTKTQWGTVRLMHVIALKEGHIYILTASALADEFSLFYKDFFASMRSLKIIHDLYEMAESSERNLLKNSVSKLVNQFQTLIVQKQKESPEIPLKNLHESTFDSQEFQENAWKPFTETLNQKYKNPKFEWHSLFLQKLKDQLLNM